MSRSSTLLRFALLLAAVALLLVVYGQGPAELLQRALDFAEIAARYPFLILALYVVRLLFLVPVSLVILLTGMLFGTAQGMAVAMLGLLLGGGVEFLIVRWLGRPLGEKSDVLRWLARLRRKIDRYPFRTVLLLRLAFVPFDAVNIVAAWAQAPLRAFLLGTALGIVPSTFSIVSAGAAVDLEVWRQSGSLWPPAGLIDWRQLLAAAMLVILTLLISRHMQKRVERSAAVPDS